jgi:hypothetical protein
MKELVDLERHNEVIAYWRQTGLPERSSESKWWSSGLAFKVPSGFRSAALADFLLLAATM